MEPKYLSLYLIFKIRCTGYASCEIWNLAGSFAKFGGEIYPPNLHLSPYGPLLSLKRGADPTHIRGRNFRSTPASAVDQRGNAQHTLPIDFVDAPENCLARKKLCMPLQTRSSRTVFPSQSFCLRRRLEGLRYR